MIVTAYAYAEDNNNIYIAGVIGPTTCLTSGCGIGLVYGTDVGFQINNFVTGLYIRSTSFSNDSTTLAYSSLGHFGVFGNYYFKEISGPYLGGKLGSVFKTSANDNNSSFNMGVGGQAGYEIKLTQKISVGPELFFLTPVSDLNTTTGGLAVFRFRFK